MGSTLSLVCGRLKKAVAPRFSFEKSPGSRVNAFCVQRCKCRPSVTSEQQRRVLFSEDFLSLGCCCCESAKVKNREAALHALSRVAEPRLANNNAAERCLSIASVNVLSH